MRIIHASGGLIGLMMDKGNLGGISTVNAISKLDAEKQREAYARLFLDNIFQAVRAVGDKSGWDVLAIGSDFDGTITHMEPYPTAKEIPTLKQDLINYLEVKKYQKDFWFGYQPKELIQKIFYKNSMCFFERFFI